MSDTPTSPLAPAGGFPQLPIVEGVRFSATSAGVKYQGRDDVMLAEIAAGSSIAGLFTRSSTRAAPVLWCEDCLKNLTDGDDAGFGILVNSGNANAFTGGQGAEGARACATAAAATLGVPENHIFLASTGVIGEVMKHDRIIASLETLKDGLSATRGEDAARAIMTTDTFAKGASSKILLDQTDITISGFAKGSGMIAPDMATMLVYIFSDVAIARPILQAILAELNAVTFNSITVDSDTSTSDTLMMAATAKADMPPITSRDDPRADVFASALHGVMQDLAHQVVRDGEGATKFIEIKVTGAETNLSAHVIGKSIANSPLVKTAIAGEDPNWGRVVMAIGKSGEPADRDLVSIWFGDILVADKGWVAPEYREDDGAAYMKQSDLVIRVDLGIGNGTAKIWTCDLTHGYITINADYRS